MKKILDNTFVRFILGLIKTIFIIFLVLFFMVTVVQRVTHNDLSIGGYRLFTIISESMVPRYEIGDVLLVKQVDTKSIKVGDNLCYLGEEEDFAGKVVTHEVKRIETNEDGTITFITEGIANVMQDPPVGEKQVYGIVVYKSIIISFISKLTNNAYSFFFLIFLPILIFILFEAKDLIDEIKGKMNDRVNRELEDYEQDEDEE